MSGGSRANSSQWRQILDTVAGPQALDELQRSLAALWTGHPQIPEDVRANITVAAFEICTNIIEHAGAGQPAHLHMGVRLLPGLIEIVFTDDGKPALVDLNAVVMPNDHADRGRGLAIAKAFLDTLGYRRHRDTNRWRLTHRLPV